MKPEKIKVSSLVPFVRYKQCMFIFQNEQAFRHFKLTPVRKYPPSYRCSSLWCFFIYQCIKWPAHKAPAINSSENDVYLSRMLLFFLVTLFGFVSIEANSVDLNRTAPI